VRPDGSVSFATLESGGAVSVCLPAQQSSEGCGAVNRAASRAEPKIGTHIYVPLAMCRRVPRRSRAPNRQRTPLAPDDLAIPAWGFGELVSSVGRD
jgi:hypothetical protein